MFMSLEEYDSALALADLQLKNDPDDPGGYFLKLTVLNNRSIDFEDEKDIPLLLTVADSVSTICDRRLAAGDKSAIVHFYRGSVDGFLMIHALRSHNYIDAMLYGKNAAVWLEKTIAIDSTFYDAYVGLGNYYYFKSKYSGLLRTTGLVQDRREEGKKMLETAAKYGLLTNFAGTSSLAWIAIAEEDFDLALRLAGTLIAEFPKNRAFNWCVGRAQMNSKRWAEAIVTYRLILNSVRQCNRNNHFNEIGCLHSLAVASFELGDWSSAIGYVNEAFGVPLSPEIADKKKNDIKHLKKILAESNTKLAQPTNR